MGVLFHNWVVEELSGLQDADDPIAELETEIAYLRRHGEAGRLSYVSFRVRGLPCGSGAIESGIRPVINLRLESNAMFWKNKNAETMLQVRSHVVPGRWDTSMKEPSEFRSSSGLRRLPVGALFDELQKKRLYYHSHMSQEFTGFPGQLNGNAPVTKSKGHFSKKNSFRLLSALQCDTFEFPAVAICKPYNAKSP